MALPRDRYLEQAEGSYFREEPQLNDLAVLIPLDGSKQAEHALSFLTALKVLPGLSVRLLTVAESDNTVPAIEETYREEAAKDYLEDATTRTRAAFDLTIDCILRVGSTARGASGDRCFARCVNAARAAARAADSFLGGRWTGNGS